MKTNRDRAGQFLWWLRRGQCDGDALDSLERRLDKAEKRGARKACQCCNPQPAPQRYTREEAVALIDTHKEAYYKVWKTFSQADIDNALETRRAVVDAIAGQPKQPQFDAEVVRGLIDGLHRYAEASIENRDDCGHLYWSSFTITIDLLRAALNIE